MKPLRFFSCLLILGFLGPLSAEEISSVPPVSLVSEVIRTGLITGDRVNLRAGPGLSYEVLFQLSKQSQVQVLAQRGQWYGIRFPQEASVYVSKLYVENNGSTGRILGDRVHVRAGPGERFSSLGFLSSGQSIEIRETVGDWVKIKPPDFCRGWIHQTYIVIVNPMQKENADGNDRRVQTLGTEGSQDPRSPAASERPTTPGPQS